MATCLHSKAQDSRKAVCVEADFIEALAVSLKEHKPLIDTAQNNGSVFYI